MADYDASTPAGHMEIFTFVHQECGTVRQEAFKTRNIVDFQFQRLNEIVRNVRQTDEKCAIYGEIQRMIVMIVNSFSEINQRHSRIYSTAREFLVNDRQTGDYDLRFAMIKLKMLESEWREFISWGEQTMSRIASGMEAIVQPDDFAPQRANQSEFMSKARIVGSAFTPSARQSYQAGFEPEIRPSNFDFTPSARQSYQAGFGLGTRPTSREPGDSARQSYHGGLETREPASSARQSFSEFRGGFGI